MSASAADPSLKYNLYFVGRKTVQNDLLVSYLERESGVSCEFFKNLEDALAACEKRDSPGIIVWDAGDGYEEVLNKLGSISSEILLHHKVLLINAKREVEQEIQAIWLGVDGLIYEDDPGEYIPRALRAILEGQLWLSRARVSDYIQSSRAARSDPALKANEILTPREREILAFVAAGRSNRQIVERLCLSTNTIKTHIYRIFK